MALKMVEAHVPTELAAEAQETLAELTSQTWTETGGRFGSVIRAVMGTSQTGPALDALHDRIAARGGLLVLVEPLDAVLPRPLASSARAVDDRAALHSAAAVSREEVYASIADGAKLHRHFMLLVVLSALVAAIGLAHDNTAAVIGAMVVAPLLAPNMAIALGLVLGDGSLVRRSLRTIGVGFALTLGFAMLLGLALDFDPTARELASRTRVTIWDLALALAAGCAGAVAFTTGAPTYLTGVMVAVALLPPTVASGMYLSAGDLGSAGSAMLLAVGNVTAVTLAAILTFVWQGMRPRNWWLAERARSSARLGIGIFVVLLAALAAVIFLFRGA
jgi:uncharacterized hydrophobic protein (TIGR00341 family)